MSYCKAGWKVLDVIIKDWNYPECYSNVYIKLDKWNSFLVYEWKLKKKKWEWKEYIYNYTNNINKTYKLKCDSKDYVFSKYSDLPSIGDNVNYIIEWWTNYIYNIENSNYQSINSCTNLRSLFFNYYPFYNKCNLDWKIQEVHREYERWDAMKVHLKVKIEEWTYNVKTYEWLYFWHWYTVLWRDPYFSPKLLKWWWVSFYKPWMDFKYVIDKDTWKILREWNDKEIDNCNVWEQKLSDFKFEWWLTNIEVIDLNMKKFREYKWIKEPETTWKEKYEENNFVFWFENTNFGWWLMISLLMLILFITAILKNNIKQFKLS